MKYRTFENKNVDTTEIDQQHLSNIFWYQKIICEVTPPTYITDELKLRFDGKILPYKPKSTFKGELLALESLGLLRWNETKDRADIFYKNEIIGEYVTIQANRTDVISQIID